MIQNLIEGIAYYCNTQDQYRALENVCYTFKSPVSMDHSQLSDYIPLKNKTDEEIDREIRQDRINLARSGGGVTGKFGSKIKDVYFKTPIHGNPIQHATDSIKLEFQSKRDEMAFALRRIREAKMKGDSYDVEDWTKDLNKYKAEYGSTDEDKENIKNNNRNLESDLFNEDFTKRNNRDINIGKSIKDNYYKRMNINDSIPKYTAISGVGGAVGGSGLGVLIGDKIAKKKGWSRTKSRVIGGLLGGVAGAGLGAGGSYLYGKHRVSSFKNKINDAIDNYKKISVDDMNKINTMYPNYKDYAKKYQLVDPNQFDDYKIK
jgi:hypothetical protein